MTENVQAIFVRETETRHQPKPHTVYKVEVHAAVRNWVVWKRYSEFTKLHSQLVSISPKHPPPVELPNTHWIRKTFGNADRIEDRRRGLEDYLRGILSSRDDRWRQTEIWREFLSVPSGRQLDASTMYNSESWLDEYNGMTNTAREVRSLINKRTTHIERDEISASHNRTVEAKKLLVALTSRLSNLEAGLVGLANGANFGSMSEGELRRRQDMLSNLKDEKDVLLKLVSAGRPDTEMLYSKSNTTNNSHTSKAVSQEQSSSDRQSLLSSSNGPTNTTATGQANGSNGSYTRQTTIRRGRAFGAAAKSAPAKETAETRVLDEDGLVQYQRQVMLDQDSELEQYSALLARQRHIGLAIGDELEAQNQILDELDNDVDRTQMKLKFANKKLGKVT